VLGITGVVQTLGQAYWEQSAGGPPSLPEQSVVLLRDGGQAAYATGESIAGTGGLTFAITPPQARCDFVRISFSSPGGYANITYTDNGEPVEIGAYDAAEGARAFVFPLPHSSPLESVYFTVQAGAGRYSLDSVDFFD
jgi:hypothetical protein